MAIRHLVMVGLTFITLGFDQESPPLLPAPGQSLKRNLAGGENHPYKIWLEAGQFLSLAVEQISIDVVVSAYDPKSAAISEVDRPNGARGTEAISLIAKSSGWYRIEVRSLAKTAPRGDYLITIRALRSATGDSDHKRLEAERAMAEGENYRARENAEGWRASLEKFGQARSLWHELNDPYEEAVACYGLGWSQRSLGDYEAAIRSFRLSVELMQASARPDGAATSLTALAWVHLYTGEYEKAGQLLGQALDAHQRLSNLRGESVTLYGLGWRYALVGEHERALEFFRQSLPLRRQLNDRPGQILTLSGTGLSESMLGRNESALENLGQALRLAREMKKPGAEAEPLAKLGWVLLALGRNSEAFEHFEQSWKLCQAAGDLAGEANTLYGLARVESQQGKLLSALEHIESALKIVESLRLHNADLQLRSSYLAITQDYYRFHVELLMRLSESESSVVRAAAAFQASERARARSLLETLHESCIDLRSDVAPELIERERSLHQELNDRAFRHRNLQAGGKSNQAALIAREIEMLTAELQTVRAQIRKASPRYAALTEPDPVTVEQVQRELLDPDTLLLEFALGAERSYLWLISSSGLQTFTLPSRREIEKASLRVYELVAARGLENKGEPPSAARTRIKQADAELPDAAMNLSRMLLGQASSYLGHKRLLIVADGALQFIPFRALPVPDAVDDLIRRNKPDAPDSQSKILNPRSAVPLIVQNEIISLPSASTLALLRREAANRKPVQNKIAILADPVFEPDDERLQALRQHIVRMTSDRHPPALLRSLRAFGEAKDSPGGTYYLNRLAYAGWEAEEISRLAPGPQTLKATGFRASRELALSGRLSDYEIIHFAAHGFIHDGHSELSGLALSLVDEAGQPRDGFLRLHEIYSLRLQAGLVVLSACQTGIGKEIKGEGLMSLTRGFMYAGTPRVIVSYLKVNDQASANLMVKFYRHLLGSKSKTKFMSAAAALRAAQIEMWQNPRWSHPYFWAGFTIQGEWR